MSDTTLAARMGAMQQSATGFPAAWNSCRTLSTSGLTVISAPWKPKVDRFLAAPKPPGKRTASAASVVRSERGLGAQRAILADSTSTLGRESRHPEVRHPPHFLAWSISSPLVWSTTWCWATSGAKTTTSASALGIITLAPVFQLLLLFLSSSWTW